MRQECNKHSRKVFESALKGLGEVLPYGDGYLIDTCFQRTNSSQFAAYTRPCSIQVEAVLQNSACPRTRACPRMTGPQAANRLDMRWDNFYFSTTLFCLHFKVLNATNSSLTKYSLKSIASKTRPKAQSPGITREIVGGNSCTVSVMNSEARIGSWFSLQRRTKRQHMIQYRSPSRAVIKKSQLHLFTHQLNKPEGSSLTLFQGALFVCAQRHTQAAGWELHCN